MSANKFRDYLKSQTGIVLDDPEAKRIITAYRMANSDIADLWKKGDKALAAIASNGHYEFGAAKLVCDSEGVLLPNGMRLLYPGLRKGLEGNYEYDSKYGRKGIYGAALVENVTQALARIVVFDQMCKMEQELRKLDEPTQRYRTVLSVHDETVLVVPKLQADWALERLMAHMATPPSWAKNLPVACEGGIGATYAAAK
jgi:DNA polymerase